MIYAICCFIWNFNYFCVEPYIDLFRTTNAITNIPELFPTAKESMISHLMAPSCFLDDDMANEVKGLVEALPDGTALVHGDGHPCNVLLCGESPSRSLMLIDMGDIACGHPIMEIIGWTFLMNGNDLSPSKIIGPRVIGLDYEFMQTMFRKMITSYLKLSDEETIDQAVEAAANLGAIRFLCMDQVRNLPLEKQQRSIAMCKMAIEKKQELLESMAYLTELIDTCLVSGR